MKQLFCLLCIALYGCISVPLGDLEQQNIFMFEGMDKQQLLQKSSAWVSTSFRTNKAVLISIDPETGKIIVSASTSWNSMLSTLTVYVQILIEVRDGRVRFTMTPTELHRNDTPVGLYETDLHDCVARLSVLKDSYTEYMRNSTRDTEW
jgi:hypothetical protein